MKANRAGGPPGTFHLWKKKSFREKWILLRKRISFFKNKVLSAKKKEFFTKRISFSEKKLLFDKKKEFLAKKASFCRHTSLQPKNEAEKPC